MSKMKKFFSLLLALTMGISMAACGDKDDSSTPNSSVTESSSTTSASSPSESTSDSTGDSSSDEGTSEEPETPGDETGEITYTPREKAVMPVAEIVDKDYDYGDPSTWAGDSYTSQDLGYVY